MLKHKMIDIQPFLTHQMIISYSLTQCTWKDMYIKLVYRLIRKFFKWYKPFWSLFLLRIYNIVPTIKYIKLGFLFRLFGIRVCMKAQCNSRNVPLKLWLPIWRLRIKTSFIICSLTSSDLVLHKVWFWSDLMYILK